MDKIALINTVKAMRDELAHLARNTENEVTWQNVQAGDAAIEFLRDEDGATNSDVVNSILKYCTRYITRLGRLEGMIQMMELRHPILIAPYNPVGQVIDEELKAAGRDFWLMCNLLKEMDDGDNKQEGVSGGPGESGTERHVQSGGRGLFCDPAPEAPENSGSGTPSW